MPNPSNSDHLDPIHYEPDETRKSTVAGGLTDDERSSGSFNDDAIGDAIEAQDACPASSITVTE